MVALRAAHSSTMDKDTMYCEHGIELGPDGICLECEEKFAEEFDYEVWTNPDYASCSGPEHWAFLYS